ncbi:DUF559 domain-containing protein [bacterium]|nr:DUF559 domain-containing protein [bacterium]
MKCEYCKKNGFKAFKNLHGHQAKCPKYIKYITKYRNSILTKKYLSLNITKLKRACYELELELNDPKIRTRDIIARCKSLNIKTQTIKEAMNNSLTKEKRINTNIKKYGYKNNFQSPQTKKTLKKKYGENIVNVFQVESIKNKIKETMIKKYGVEYTVEMPSYRRNNGNKSIPHKRVEKLLDKYNVCYISENINSTIEFKRYNKALHKIYNPRPDIIIESKKIIFEIYGDLYHANPKKYKPNDIIVTWDGELKAKEIWKKDKIRINHLKSFDYKVYRFWVSDIQRDFKKFEEKICRLLKLKALQK